MTNSAFTVTGTAGTITSVATGTGLRGGPITTTGTVNLATTNAMSHRLTLTSGQPVEGSDVTAATTLYLTPYNGVDIDVYSGSAWIRFQQAELSITTSGLAVSTVYDVFIQYNSGTPQLSLTAWTNPTTRATALAYQNGVLVLSGTTTSRYLGTVSTDGSTKFNNTSLNRTVWNYYNRVTRPVSVVTATGNWQYTTATWRQANADTANQVNIVCGVQEDAMYMQAFGMFSNSGGGITAGVAIGVNSTSVNSAQILAMQYATAANFVTGVSATYNGLISLGYNPYVWLESSQASGTTTWFGTSASGAASSQVSGLIGNIRC